MKKNKLSIKLAMSMAIMQIIVMFCMFMFISISLSNNIRKITINNMEMISAHKAKIIEDYIRSSEEFLTAYSRAGEITDVLSSPNDENAVAAAQQYTETFSADKSALEGIYVSEWNTHVLAHTNPEAYGMILRKDEALKSLQDSMLASDGVYNTGIIISPVSKNQVISMYRACYDSSGNPVGFVGGAIFTNELFDELKALPKNGMEDSKFYLLNVKTGEYIYTDDNEKVATVAQEDYIVDIINKLKDDSHENGYTEYKIGKDKYLSSYHYMADKDWVFITEDSKDEIFASVKQIEIILFIICLAATIGITALSFIMLIAILNPLNTIKNAVNKLGEGDISENDEINKYVRRTDEIGQISQSVKHLQNNLKDIVTVITKKAVDLDNSNQEFSERFAQIYTAISAINNAVDEIAIGATGQANDTFEAKNEVKAIADELVLNSNDVAQLDSAISKTSELFEEMTNILEDLTNISEKTINTIVEVASKTEATNKSSEKIRSAVNLIKDITDQTNLLSLNASIEAARAGEAGRGFAVVADEIRNLADESTQSAEEIEKIVEDLVNNSNASLTETENLNSILEKQKNELQLTMKGFDSLKNEVISVEEASESINSSNERMEQQQNKLNSLIQNLSAISEENAAGCEETSATMASVSEDINICNEKVHTLTDLSENLKAQVSHFKL